jgi:type I restriction enzyme S subunit
MKTSLGEVCTARSSLVDPTKEENKDLPHIAPDSIERDTGRLLDFHSAFEDGVTSGKYKFHTGDVLYSKIRPYLNKVIIADFAGLCSADMYALVVDQQRTTPQFITHLLRSPDFLDYSYLQSNRANIPKLNRNQLMRYEFDLPPLEEQRRIAEILDQADVIRTKRRHIHAHLDTLSRSIFHDMFGDPLTSSTEVPIEPLRAWVEPDRPITYGILKPGPNQEDGVPYVRVADMKNRGINLSGIRRTSSEIANEYRRSMLQPGDLIMSIRGHVGRFALVPPELSGANITQDSARVAIKDPNTAAYVRAAIESPRMQDWMARRTKGAAVKGINLGDLRELPLPVPSSEQQHLFASRIQQVDAQRALVQRALDADNELFASLQSRAFRGEL